jgi:hypothetical protein
MSTIDRTDGPEERAARDEERRQRRLARLEADDAATDLYDDLAPPARNTGEGGALDEYVARLWEGA